jgi:hypothetical protein
MRKAIIIIIQILILIIFLRTSFAQHFFGGIADTLVGWYESIVEVPERSKIIVLRDKFMRNNMSLQPYQVDYVIEVTDSVEDIDKFYNLYCVLEDKNPYIFGVNLAKLCKEIKESELLTKK